jgi:hypothetical protein
MENNSGIKWGKVGEGAPKTHFSGGRCLVMPGQAGPGRGSCRLLK